MRVPHAIVVDKYTLLDKIVFALELGVFHQWSFHAMVAHN